MTTSGTAAGSCGARPLKRRGKCWWQAALGILAETTALGVPIAVLPFVNSALAARAPFRRSIEDLSREGVHILLGPGGVMPHQPNTGGDLITSYPRHLALSEAGSLTDPAAR